MRNSRRSLNGLKNCGLPIGQENAMPPYCGVIDTVPVEALHD